MTKRIFGLLAIAAGSAMLAGGAAAQETMRLNGAGATFPYPIYSKWMLEYHAAHPNVEINYQSIGSGGGIRQYTDHTVDFGASDGPMTDAQIQAVSGNVLHFPTVLGADVPTYNIPGVSAQLRFTGDVLASIFLGQITKWNDSRLTALNPGVSLPDQDIVVVHRSDGSGTTYIWTDYLSKVSPDWAQRVGKGTSVNWPVGLGGQGNEGVANTVKQTPGAIGYVELIYAKQNHISYGVVRNKAGNYIEASLQTATNAAAGAVAALDQNTDFRISITDPDGAQAYPIASFTWLLVPKEMTDMAKARALLEFVWWATHDGQQYNEALAYAKLPARVVQLEEQRLKSVTVNGQTVLPRNYRGR
ncbi:MAG TPA: phosphate ABC transporter substrate-binding protein PstS [Streptosporangiaceae bacterium]|nr:phosphate ABC transporter substrate-binding protein PstS [Streptosporangiaceae bacterium]